MQKYDFDRLVEIQSEMLELLQEAKQLLRNEGFAYEQAKAYWLAHIEMGLTNDSSYVGKSMCSMEDTINLVNPGDDEECDESEDSED